jgi:hypothetical protein
MNDIVEKNHVILTEGKPKTVTAIFNKEKIFCEIAANEKLANGKPVIFLRFAVGNVDKQGNKVLVAKPELTTVDKEPAQVSVIGDNGSEALSISVLTTRQVSK